MMPCTIDGHARRERVRRTGHTAREFETAAANRLRFRVGSVNRFEKPARDHRTRCMRIASHEQVFVDAIAVPNDQGKSRLAVDLVEEFFSLVEIALNGCNGLQRTCE